MIMLTVYTGLEKQALIRSNLTQIKNIYNHSTEENMKIKHANKFIQNIALVDPTTCVYQLIFMKMTLMTQK